MAATRDFQVREKHPHRIRDEAMQKAELMQHAPAQVPTASPSEGYYGSPVLKAPAWTWEVPLYFFTGGAAGAAAIIASAAKLSDGDAKLVRDAQWLAAIGGALSPALLTADLGMPSRFLNMFRVFKVQSPMSVGSWTLLVFSSAAAATAMLGELERRSRRRIPVFMEAAPVFSVLSGLVVSTYTGVLVGATAIPAWNQNVAILPVHFAASGLAAAAAILELRGNWTPALNTLGIGAAAVETITGAALEIRKTAATEPLRSGASGWTMRAAGFLSGPLPLALRLLASAASRKRSGKLRTAAAISAVAGSLMTRWAWVEAGRASSKDPKPPLLVSTQQPELANLKEKLETQPALKSRSTASGGN